MKRANALKYIDHRPSLNFKYGRHKAAYYTEIEPDRYWFKDYAMDYSPFNYHTVLYGEHWVVPNMRNYVGDFHWSYTLQEIRGLILNMFYGNR